jgi:hypothetical protein
MGDTTDPGGATHVGIKEMAGSYFQASLLQSGCREEPTSASTTEEAIMPGRSRAGGPLPLA